ncbi:hypothetical protein ACFL6U_31825 [Planctomycetota bacterium]
MQVIYLSTSGGFADFIDLDKSMTIEKFFSKFVPNSDEADCLIRVNEQSVPRYYILKNNDRITIIPLDELATI